MNLELRENWRIVLLVLLLLFSGAALFAPGGGGGPTSLQYGIELSGGTELRAELPGLTAEELSIGPDDVNPVARTVASELDVNQTKVQVRQQAGTVEVFDTDVTQSEFAAALQAAGLDASTGNIRQGVTTQTYETAAQTIQQRIGGLGLSGGTAAVSQTGTGDAFIRIEVPNERPGTVKERVRQTGRVQIVATHPVELDNGTTVTRRTPLLTQGDFRSIKPASQATQTLAPHVPVVLTDRAAKNFSSAMRSFGFTGPGVSNCRWEQNTSNPGYCLLTVVNGEVTYSAGMSPDLASDFEVKVDGSVPFLQDPSFVMQTESYSRAQDLKRNLESGALPMKPIFPTESFVAPSLAEKFKPLAVLTGLVAWLAVTGVIFLRYREPKVALPMLGVAAAEVFILLGFAASVGLALNLSHIAGFIAVIGTGVDDLVIIADEILQRGEVATGRVFQSRFRKAFWVIGVAAATTILAMGPLVALDLGDLRGFAIVTIVGVLIGVLVTRPAYGNILRNLLIEEE